MINLSFCPDVSSSFLNFFDLSVAPPLLFYVYIPICLLTFFFGSHVLRLGQKTHISKYFSYITLAFGVWIFLILFQWTAIYLEVVHLAWQLLVIPELLIFIFSVFFCYSYIFKKDVNKYLKHILYLVYGLSVILVSTRFNISSFDFYYCEGIVGGLWDLIYVFEFVCLAIVFVMGVEGYRGSRSHENKLRSTLLPIGTIVFLGIFWASNYFGELTKTYEINLIGPLGMVLFLGILAYLMVRFKIFNAKILGSEILVVSTWIFVFALLFINRLDYIRLVVVATLVLLAVLGIYLVRGVKREVALREKLQEANEGQANLLHIINHQIKGYLAKSRDIFSELISDPSYKACTVEAKPMLDEGFNSLTEGVDFVKNFLDAANIENGTYAYDMEKLDFKTLVDEAVRDHRDTAKSKGLELLENISEGEYHLRGDKTQLSQAVRNLIENSILYTPKGNVSVGLVARDNKVLLSVKDTGVGISSELKPKLFTRGGRDKDSMKINVNSTGFGLSFVKNVVLAHGGRVWAESPGPGKGSTFYLELPMVR